MVKRKDIIRRIKGIAIKEYRLIESASKRIDQYGNKENYKEKFYNIARQLQKNHSLTQTEAINKASEILKAMDKQNLRAKKEVDKQEYYDALMNIDETLGLDASDVAVIERESP